MSDKTNCFVCQNAKACKKTLDDFNESWFECDICGHYIFSSLTLQLQGHDYAVDNWKLTPLQRAVLSHRIRTQSADSPTAGSKPFTITVNVLKAIRSSAQLPNPAVQAANLIRFVGDHASRSGEPVTYVPMNEMDCHHAIIGALDSGAVMRLTKELIERKLLTAEYFRVSSFVNVTLSLDGWERYEAEKRGGFDGY